jgi:hypothetical protein
MHFASLYGFAKKAKKFVVSLQSKEERYQPVMLGIQIGTEG